MKAAFIIVLAVIGGYISDFLILVIQQIRKLSFRENTLDNYDN
jgi:hypothetical protein